MARNAGITVENNFTQGLITEYSAMNFPENAITEGENLVFNELGKVTRRSGIDYEDNYQVHSTTSITSNPGAVSEYVWQPVDNEGSLTFIVQQTGDTVSFFQSASPLSISANKTSFEIDLDLYKTPGTSSEQLRDTPCKFTSGKGYLYMAHAFCSPLQIEYEPLTDTIVITQIDIEIRDFEGELDGYAVDDRPLTLEAKHKYNLLNQGWYYLEDGTSVITQWFASRAVYPSNADIWWVYKDSNENFNPARADNFSFGNTPAPKGHYIYSAFNIDRETASGLTGLTSVSSGTSRPSVIAFFAGRVFYSGVNSPKYSNLVYYSQIVDNNNNNVGKCYQANDPTSESVFDLLDTDGGVVQIPTLDTIVDMRVIGDALLVFGSNGVVALRGSDNGPFRATNFTLDFISNTGALSPFSILEIEGAIVWLNADGIYSVSKDQIGISFAVTNVSKTTIQSVYNDVPSENKYYIKGCYNKREKIARWLFSDSESITGYNYNKLLDLNIVSKAFYVHSIDTTLAPRISGVINIAGDSLLQRENTVVAGSDTVVVGTDTVIEQVYGYIPNVEIFKFVITGNISTGTSGLTYGEMSDTSYKDWVSFNSTGTEFLSYGISGYRVRGEMLKNFNSSVIGFVMEQEAGSSLLLQGIWNYGEKVTSTQQVYVDNPSAEYIIRRVKLRGKGKSLQLKFRSHGTAPFTIVGWSTFDTGGTLP